ncbi:MAG TPA: class I SAM-dependent methyltransferase [Candidatus Limnocylindrales bacterium]|nr:class I SAM-dependent methyltransferase [Candidatus Limnocylindrales bacterium]
MKTLAKRVLRGGSTFFRRLIPLRGRRRIVAWLGRHAWIPYRDVVSIELLRDFAEREPNEAHRFLWAHHLAYAESYEVERRFGADRINETRHMLFADLRAYLMDQGVDPAVDIRSVFEVGCSLGYLLRHLETTMFTSATSIEGVDIDRYAIEQGSAHLGVLGSKVNLRTFDIADLETALSGRTVDVILCLGVLLYLPQADAHEVVRAILRHTGVVAAFAGLAHPTRDNATLHASVIRDRDATFIHDIDEMVNDGGGSVAWRRWEGPRLVDGNTVYFVFARPSTR